MPFQSKEKTLLWRGESYTMLTVKAKAGVAHQLERGLCTSASLHSWTLLMEQTPVLPTPLKNASELGDPQNQWTLWHQGLPWALLPLWVWKHLLLEHKLCMTGRHACMHATNKRILPMLQLTCQRQAPSWGSWRASPIQQHPIGSRNPIKMSWKAKFPSDILHGGWGWERDQFHLASTPKHQLIKLEKIIPTVLPAMV